MMGRLEDRQSSLFYDFCLEDRIPSNHPLRSLDAVLHFEKTRAVLARYYSHTGQGRGMEEVLREIGVTGNTYYRWRKEYGGLGLDQARRLKELETENGRLKRAVAELTLDKLILTSRFMPLISCAICGSSLSKTWRDGFGSAVLEAVARDKTSAMVSNTWLAS